MPPCLFFPASSSFCPHLHHLGTDPLSFRATCLVSVHPETDLGASCPSTVQLGWQCGDFDPSVERILSRAMGSRVSQGFVIREASVPGFLYAMTPSVTCSSGPLPSRWSSGCIRRLRMRDTKERVIFVKSGDGCLPSRFLTQPEQPRRGELSSIVLTVTNNGSMPWQELLFT